MYVHLGEKGCFKTIGTVFKPWKREIKKIGEKKIIQEIVHRRQGYIRMFSVKGKTKPDPEPQKTYAAIGVEWGGVGGRNICPPPWWYVYLWY